MNSLSKMDTMTDAAIITAVADKVVRRGLSVPAIFFLETMKPLNFIGAQLLVFFGPFLDTIFPGEKYYRFTDLMEKRENVDILLNEIERLEDERHSNIEKEKKDRPQKGLFKRRSKC